MCPQGHGGSSPPSDTTRRAPTQKLVSQAKFDVVPVAPQLARAADPSRACRPRLALPALRERPASSRPSRWRHWIVAVEPTGRITVPAPAREVLRVNAVHAVTRGSALILRAEGIGAPVAVDRRGRLALPAWLRRASAPAHAVLVAAGRDDATVVVAPASVLDDLVGCAVEETT